jgi:hypothetical protein
MILLSVIPLSGAHCTFKIIYNFSIIETLIYKHKCTRGRGRGVSFKKLSHKNAIKHEKR